MSDTPPDDCKIELLRHERAWKLEKTLSAVRELVEEDDARELGSVRLTGGVEVPRHVQLQAKRHWQRPFKGDTDADELMERVREVQTLLEEYQRLPFEAMDGADKMYEDLIGVRPSDLLHDRRVFEFHQRPRKATLEREHTDLRARQRVASFGGYGESVWSPGKWDPNDPLLREVWADLPKVDFAEEGRQNDEFQRGYLPPDYWSASVDYEALPLQERVQMAWAKMNYSRRRRNAARELLEVMRDIEEPERRWKPYITDLTRDMRIRELPLYDNEQPDARALAEEDVLEIIRPSYIPEGARGVRGLTLETGGPSLRYHGNFVVPFEEEFDYEPTVEEWYVASGNMMEDHAIAAHFKSLATTLQGSPVARGADIEQHDALMKRTAHLGDDPDLIDPEGAKEYGVLLTAGGRGDAAAAAGTSRKSRRAGSKGTAGADQFMDDAFNGLERNLGVLKAAAEQAVDLGAAIDEGF
jgi:hypothetical protein